MSIIGEMWEESDWEKRKKEEEFLAWLQNLPVGELDEIKLKEQIVDKYKEQFNFNGTS